MDLTLSLDERARFSAALSAVLTPVAIADDERWGRAVAGTIGALVGSTSAVVVLQSGRAVRAFGDGIGDDLLRRFIQTPHLPRLTPYPVGGHIEPTTVRSRVFCRLAPSPPGADGSPAGPLPSPGDGVMAGRSYSAVGATAELGIPDVYASVACHYHQPQSADDTARRLELVRLLLPAFASASRERLLAGTTPRHLTRRLLDTVSAGALLYSADAGVFYENQALTRALDAHPERERLRDELERIARLAGRAADDCPLSDAAAEERVAATTRELTTVLGSYVARCTLVTPADGVRPSTVAVALEPVPARAPRAVAPSLADLRDRFGLTDREVDVTHLLSTGKSNSDIARELGISPFTARHHTERVLGKLGARSRAEVPARLHGSSGLADSPQVS